MNEMKYLIICVAALVFACSDSPNEAGTTENENTAIAFRLGECVGSPFDDAFENQNKEALARKIFAAAGKTDRASEELPKAYIVQDSAGNDQIMIPKVSDYCKVTPILVYTLSGDTLEIEYGGLGMVTKCVCFSDHWFGLPSEYKDIKYIRFKEVIYEIDPGPAPEPSKPKERE